MAINGHFLLKKIIFKPKNGIFGPKMPFLAKKNAQNELKSMFTVINYHTGPFGGHLNHKNPNPPWPPKTAHSAQKTPNSPKFWRKKDCQQKQRYQQRALWQNLGRNPRVGRHPHQRQQTGGSQVTTGTGHRPRGSPTNGRHPPDAQRIAKDKNVYLECHTMIKCKDGRRTFTHACATLD